MMATGWGNALAIAAASIMAGVNVRPMFHEREPEERNLFYSGVKDGPEATQSDLLAKSHGKRSKRAQRRKGASHD